jgi:hypothetical protein
MRRDGVGAAQENALAQTAERIFSRRWSATFARRIFRRRFPHRIRQGKVRVHSLKHFSFFLKKTFRRILPYFVLDLMRIISFDSVHESFVRLSASRG